MSFGNTTVSDIQHQPVLASEAQPDSGTQLAAPCPPAQPAPSHRPKRRGRPRIGRGARAELNALRKETAQLVTPEVAHALATRPRTRADCVAGPRPCPFAGCRHSLLIEVNPATGSVKLIHELDTATDTCSLDVADRGGLSLEEVGQLTNVTRERIRQIEVRGLALLKLRMPRW